MVTNTVVVAKRALLNCVVWFRKLYWARTVWLYDPTVPLTVNVREPEVELVKSIVYELRPAERPDCDKDMLRGPEKPFCAIAVTVLVPVLPANRLGKLLGLDDRVGKEVFPLAKTPGRIASGTIVLV